MSYITLKIHYIITNCIIGRSRSCYSGSDEAAAVVSSNINITAILVFNEGKYLLRHRFKLLIIIINFKKLLKSK